MTKAKKSPPPPRGRVRERGSFETLGVTRVARVTGLDRTGVEVACAVRPLGHVLQVTQGKGPTFEHAAATALSEAAELWASEQVDASRLQWDSFEGLLARRPRVEAWSALELGSG